MMCNMVDDFFIDNIYVECGEYVNQQTVVGIPVLLLLCPVGGRFILVFL